MATLDDALALVNSNEHGNGTALFTRSGAAARKFQSEVDVGMVRGGARVYGLVGSKGSVQKSQSEMDVGMVRATGWVSGWAGGGAGRLSTWRAGVVSLCWRACLGRARMPAPEL